MKKLMTCEKCGRKFIPPRRNTWAQPVPLCSNCELEFFDRDKKSQKPPINDSLGKEDNDK